MCVCYDCLCVKCCWWVYVVGERKGTTGKGAHTKKSSQYFYFGEEGRRRRRSCVLLCCCYVLLHVWVCVVCEEGGKGKKGTHTTKKSSEKKRIAHIKSSRGTSIPSFFLPLSLLFSTPTTPTRAKKKHTHTHTHTHREKCPPASYEDSPGHCCCG